MTTLFLAVLALFRAATRSRLELAAEMLALRHQLSVLQRTANKAVIYQWESRKRTPSAVFWAQIERLQAKGHEQTEMV